MTTVISVCVAYHHKNLRGMVQLDLVTHYEYEQGCNFWKLIGGAERGKDAQGTIKILMDTDFTSDLAHFLHNIGGAQLNIGGNEALPKRYKVTPISTSTSHSVPIGDVGSERRSLAVLWGYPLKKFHLFTVSTP